jgi:hypothetical protein
LAVPHHLHGWHISDYELLAHVVAIRLWGPSWYGFKVWGLTDSEPAELLLRHGRTRINRRLAMARTIASLEHTLGFMWVSGAVRSKDNVLPDCASRWRDPERRATFWQTCADLNLVPTERQILPLMLVF